MFSEASLPFSLPAFISLPRAFWHFALTIVLCVCALKVSIILDSCATEVDYKLEYRQKSVPPA